MTNDNGDNPLGERNVIKPIFGQGPDGAEVVTPIFGSQNKIDLNISGTSVTLLKQNMFETDVQSFIIPQFPNRVSRGGIAYAGMEKFGTAFNDAYGEYLKDDKGADKIAGLGFVGYQDPDTQLIFFHTLTVKMGHLQAARVVMNALNNVLYFCEQSNIKTLAVPAMCTGVEGELTDEQSAKTIANTIYRFSQNQPSDVNITVAISGYDDKARFKAFAEVFQNPYLYEDFDPETTTGERLEDPRRVIAEKVGRGDSPYFVVDGKGQIVTTPDSENGAVIYPFGKPKL